jgi:hypothetical protein
MRRAGGGSVRGWIIDPLPGAVHEARPRSPAGRQHRAAICTKTDGILFRKRTKQVRYLDGGIAAVIVNIQ